MQREIGIDLGRILDPGMDTKLGMLPPGPWHASGAGVYAGKTLVALMVHKDHRRAEALAEIVARLPDWVRILSVANPSLMSERVVELEEKVKQLEEEVKSLDEEADDLY